MANHPRDPGFQSGENWVECDVCGMDFRASEVKWRWDGLLVCEEDWEPRHQQDYVRPREDVIAAQGPVRSEPDDEFVTVTGATSPEPPPSGTFDNDL